YHGPADVYRERLQARDIRLPVRDIDGESADLLGPTPGRAHDRQHPPARARPPPAAPGARGAGLPAPRASPAAARGAPAGPAPAPPPAARTTSSTRSSAPAHCSTSPARSGAVCPATNSIRPPAGVSMP